MPRPQTFDHLRSSKKPITRKVLIALDPEIGDKYLDAKDRFSLCKVLVEMKVEDSTLAEKRAAEFEEARLAYDEATAELEENSAEFVFRSMGRKKYEDLLLEHQPTPSQQKKAKETGEHFNWNPDTFPIAVIQKSLLSPELSESEVKEIWDGEDWSQAETILLLEAAISCNTQRRDLNLGKD